MVTNSHILTNMNNNDNKYNNVKQSDTNFHERVNTDKANLNTMVQITNNDMNPRNTKMNTSVNQSM
jgi:hypothetical protein